MQNQEKSQHNWYAVIPAEILLDKTLSSTQKLLVALISNLANSKGYCYASNSYLADCLNLTPNTISENITKLEERSIITRNIIRNSSTKQIEVRQIKIVSLPLFNRTPLRKKQDTPIPKKPKSNNKVFNNKDNSSEQVKILVI